MTTDLQLESSFVMIEQDFAKISSMRQLILEDTFASQGDMPTELLPSGQARGERRFECLGGIIVSH